MQPGGGRGGGGQARSFLAPLVGGVSGRLQPQLFRYFRVVPRVDVVEDAAPSQLHLKDKERGTWVDRDQRAEVRYVGVEWIPCQGSLAKPL